MSQFDWLKHLKEASLGFSERADLGGIYQGKIATLYLLRNRICSNRITECECVQPRGRRQRSGLREGGGGGGRRRRGGMGQRCRRCGENRGKREGKQEEAGGGGGGGWLLLPASSCALAEILQRCWSTLCCEGGAMAWRRGKKCASSLGLRLHWFPT